MLTRDAEKTGPSETKTKTEVECLAFNKCFRTFFTAQNAKLNEAIVNQPKFLLRLNK